MAEDREGFLGRWSRLKRAGGESPQDDAPASKPEQVAARAPDPAAGDERAHGVEGERAAEAAELDLPPIESLTRHSDYSVFMKPGVPLDLQRKALRKLWVSDPVFANMDGLIEYGEDYSLPFKMTKGKVVATLYRVGQGMPDPVKEIAKAVVGEDAPDRPAAGAEIDSAEPAEESGNHAGEPAGTTVSEAPPEADATGDAPSSDPERTA